MSTEVLQRNSRSVEAVRGGVEFAGVVGTGDLEIRTGQEGKQMYTHIIRTSTIGWSSVSKAKPEVFAPSTDRIATSYTG